MLDADTLGPINGIKISRRDQYSDYIFLGPPSCYSYISFSDLPYSPAASGDESHNSSPNQMDQESLLEKQLRASRVSCELQVLSIKGAFCLPSRYICLKLIDAYFQYSYPHYPVIDKDAFLDHFNDPNPNKRPPLILINAVLLAGAKSCTHESIIDSSGHAFLARKFFFTRIKALMDSECVLEYANTSTTDNFDDGEIVFNYYTVLVQVYILLAIFYDGMDDVSKGPYFCIKSAVTISQALGLHKDMKDSHVITVLRAKYKGLLKDPAPFERAIAKQCFVWRKLWWTVTKEKFISMAHGRPSALDLSETNTALLTLDDFEKYESRNWSINNPNDRLIANFSIHLVKLAEISGEICKDQFFITNPDYLQRKPPSRYQHFIKQHNLLMGLFFKDLPSDLKFSSNDPKSINIYSAILTSTYYIMLYHINRLKLTDKDTTKYWGISFQSAFLIAQIAEVLTQLKLTNKNLLFTSHLVYNTTLALFILTFHTDSKNPTVSEAASRQSDICYQFLLTLKNDWKGVVLLLLQFFDRTFKASREETIAKAKQSVLKDNERFRALLQNSHKSNSLKSFEINFLLNKDKNNDSDTDNWHEFLITDEEYSNPELPLSNILTMKIPKPDDEFYRNFSVTKLFPAKVNKSANETVGGYSSFINSQISATTASMRPYKFDPDPKMGASASTSSESDMRLSTATNTTTSTNSDANTNTNTGTTTSTGVSNMTNEDTLTQNTFQPYSNYPPSHVHAHGQMYPPFLGPVPPPPPTASVFSNENNNMSMGSPTGPGAFNFAPSYY